MLSECLMQINLKEVADLSLLMDISAFSACVISLAERSSHAKKKSL